MEQRLPHIGDAVPDFPRWPDEWDFAAERRAADLRAPVAQRAPLVSLADMRQQLDADARATIILSDVHGEYQLLAGALSALGCLDGARRRVSGRGHVIQVGDLADGRHASDPDALHVGAAWCDTIICGNHEAAMLGGPLFGGFDERVAARCAPLLRALAARGQLRAAVCVQDVLITHAGVVSRSDAPQQDAAAAAAWLNECFASFLATGARMDALCNIGPERGGTAPWGGVMWCDWRALSASPARGYRQVVGHTPSPGVEMDDSGRCCCLDAAGDRVGVCLLGSDGAWMCAQYQEG